jgi:hypothetical protein
MARRFANKPADGLREALQRPEILRPGVAEQAATDVGLLPPIEIARRHDFKSAEQAAVILWRGFAVRWFVAGDNDSHGHTGR